MGIVNFTPFGRGSVSAVTDIDTPYDTLRTLSNAGLNHSNFHPDAQIHEGYIDWDTHKHDDGSLGDSVLSATHFNTAKSGSTNAEVLHTQAPKTLTICGRSRSFRIDAPTGRDPVYVDFGLTSYSRQTFMPGTVPVVLASIAKGATTTYAISMWVTDVMSAGFSVSFMNLTEDKTNANFGTIEVSYLAIGTAPGYLSRPEG